MKTLFIYPNSKREESLYKSIKKVLNLLYNDVQEIENFCLNLSNTPQDNCHYNLIWIYDSQNRCPTKGISMRKLFVNCFNNLQFVELRKIFTDTSADIMVPMETIVGSLNHDLQRIYEASDEDFQDKFQYYANAIAVYFFIFFHLAKSCNDNPSIQNLCKIYKGFCDIKNGTVIQKNNANKLRKEINGIVDVSKQILIVSYTK